MTPLHNDLSEKAILLIKIAYRDFAFGTTCAAGFGRSVVVHPRLGRQSSSDAHRESCLFRMVSIVETYTDLFFDLALTHDVPSPNVTTAQLMADALASAATWPRRKTFGATYSVPVTGFAQWSKVDAAIAARNSIAHGLGTVTRLQNVRSLQSKLRSVGISVADGRIEIPHSALVDLRSILIDYIRYLDDVRGPIET